MLEDTIIADYNSSCKTHVDGKDKLVWLCYDCRKFTCTKCYAKDHKRCWADLVENMYDELKKTNENNLTIIQGMRTEFVEESDQMEKKYQFIDKNNPFEQNIKLVEKIYNDIIRCSYQISKLIKFVFIKLVNICFFIFLIISFSSKY